MKPAPYIVWTSGPVVQGRFTTRERAYAFAAKLSVKMNVYVDYKGEPLCTYMLGGMHRRDS